MSRCACCQAIPPARNGDLKSDPGLSRRADFQWHGERFSCSVAASRQSAANFRREFKWRLSPESRYAKTAFRIPQGQRTLFLYSAWVDDWGNLLLLGELYTKLHLIAFGIFSGNWFNLHVNNDFTIPLTADEICKEQKHLLTRMMKLGWVSGFGWNDATGMWAIQWTDTGNRTLVPCRVTLDRLQCRKAAQLCAFEGLLNGILSVD